MGYFPAIWTVWIYTAVFALIALVGAAGAITSSRPRIRGAMVACCILALVALASAYITGFTFHLNTAAPISTDRLVYLVPNCLCVPDSNVQTDLEAVRVRDGQIQWRHPIRLSSFGASDRFISDDRYVYLEQYSPDATHLREYIITALDAHSGHQVWQTTSDIGGNLAITANGRLTLTNGQTDLILDPMTGKDLLRLPVQQNPAGNIVLEQNGITYACSGLNNDFTITATVEATGRQLWTSPDVFGCRLTMAPTMLLASGLDILSAIRITDGSLVWRVGEGQESSSPIILGNAVFTASTSFPSQSHAHGAGMVSARRLSDGVLLWQKSMGEYPGLYGVAENIVMAANGSSIVALRGSDGRQLWSFLQGDSSPNVSTIVEGVVILDYLHSREIIALDLHTGSFYWQAML